jgi:hypothetical protein
MKCSKRGYLEPTMSLSCRAKTSFVALFAVWTLAAPGFAQERSEAGG